MNWIALQRCRRAMALGRPAFLASRREPASVSKASPSRMPLISSQSCARAGDDAANSNAVPTPASQAYRRSASNNAGASGRGSIGAFLPRSSTSRTF